MNNSTKIFALTPGIYSSVLLKELTGRYWWILLLPVVVFLFCGRFFGTAWYFLIPIFVFLIYPMLLMWAYFILSTSPIAIDALKPHKFVINDHELIYFEYESPSHPETDETNEDKGKQRITIFEPFPHTPLRIKRSYTIPMSQLSHIRQDKDLEIYQLRHSLGKFIIIPNSCKINRHNGINQ